MDLRTPIRSTLLGTLLLTGCQLKLDPSILPVISPTKPPASVTPLATAPPADPPGGAGCDRDVPAVVPMTGTPRQGQFAGQQLPGGWGVHETERDVVYAIQDVERSNESWPCFQRFYPGAVKVYQGLGGGRIPRPPMPTAMPSTGIAVPPMPPTETPWSQPPSSPPNVIIDDWFLPPPCPELHRQGYGLSGSVYDEQGVPFEGGVEVRVSTKGYAYNTTTQVVGGRYWVYDAPAGEKLEITVVHGASGEARRRFVVPAAQYDACGPNGFAEVNFGGPRTSDDPLGHRYPLPQVDSPYKIEKVAVVRGLVMDYAGNPVDGAKVILESLSAADPWVTTAATSQGSYKVGDVPAGMPIEVSVEHPKYHARARVGVFFADVAGGKGNVVNFGAPAEAADPHGAQYALAPLYDAQAKRVPVKGMLHDQDGKAIASGKITAKSMEDGVSFQATATIQGGSYYFESIPAGVEIEFTVEAVGYEPMWRFERLSAKGGMYVHFGGEASKEDPDSEAFALVELIEDEGDAEAQ